MPRFSRRSMRTRRPHRGGVARRQTGAVPRMWSLLLLVLIALPVWALLPVAPLDAWFTVPSRPASEPGLPWLETSGGAIVDQYGRGVLLRGMNDDALVEPQLHPAPFDDRDAELMSQAGFDVVRLPITWSQLEPQRGVFSQSYLDRIAQTVAMCNRHGLYVVLDMHFMTWTPAYGGNGAPAWATVPLIPNWTWGGPVPSIRSQLSPALLASQTYWWFNREWQAQLQDAWAFVARRFKGDSGVAGYDLYNEPYAFPYPPIRFDKDLMWPFYQRSIDALSRVDPYHLFIVEADQLGDFPTTVVPLHAPDLVYSPHIYTGSLIPPTNGDPAPLRLHVREEVREAGQVPAAFWVGEFGISDNHVNATRWIDGALDALDEMHAGWAWWQWRQDGSWGIRNVAGTRLNMDFLDHLARPYLVAAPASFSAGWSQASHGVLSVAVTAHDRVLDAVIAWPQLVDGPARVLSTCAGADVHEDGGRIDVSLPPGGACSLTLSPSSPPG